jgi:hypothetical protein
MIIQQIMAQHIFAVIFNLYQLFFQLQLKVLYSHFNYYIRFIPYT